MIATLGQYKAEIDERFSENSGRLIRQLGQNADKLIVDFCIEDQAAVVLQSNGETIEFGKVTDQSSDDGFSASQAFSFSVQFTDSAKPYFMQIAQSARVVNEMVLVFWQLLSWIVLIIFLISVIGSFLCSRIFAKPVLNISRISKRMSELDMTWHCDINRTDKLGVLANSLNDMAQKLNAAMTEFRTANKQLQADIEKERRQEKQRRASFAAVSHELKMPITILKGQIENMILGIGDFKNKEKYLPLALETVERMNNLAKEILTISNLTSDDFRFSKRPVDLSVLIRECLELYKPLALKKQISLNCGSLESVSLEMDKKLFQKALSNIVSNAILYSPAGENVTITLTSKALTVEYTGVHIPEKNFRIYSLLLPVWRNHAINIPEAAGWAYIL